MVIWWIRRDLRLADNPTLAAALRADRRVLPLFVLDPTFDSMTSVGPRRQAFLLGGLRALDVDLQARGGRLVVRRGRPAEVLSRLVTETGAGAVFAHEDSSRYARRRDAEVARRVPLRLVHALTVHPPDAVRKADGTPYTVFSPFSRAWKALLPPSASGIFRAPARLAHPGDVSGVSLPPASDLLPEFPPGESEARRRLKAFVHGRHPKVYSYAGDRDRLDLVGTSGLSPYLRFGMLSPRVAVAAAREAEARAGGADERRGAQAWLDELIWREFYYAILHHFPDVQERAFRIRLRGIRWDNDAGAFDAWCEGRTGYPIVDAAMRQLQQTGWMHNRARMITGSFLVKDLLIDWRWGERFFMRHLVDGDPAANNGGWQWVAGVGTDAAPYFRVFNPAVQGAKFDPDGAYIRRWVPELRGVDKAFIHEPWRMPAAAQRAASCLVGVDYPAPIVDHAAARVRALERYGQARARAAG